ncbi:MAG: hypothetical protein CVV37_07330 [Nitrospira bacterium HGW-Nitrospira-1]|nr:MAG: hypothetical protein CVV37_07330 [Nitrospira bacterium HGW-Nitrospira-1]
MSRYDGDSILRCPFCDSPIEEPKEIMGRFGNTFNGGGCICGAAYVYDRSGHNMGDAYVDVLSLACDGDLDKAWSMTPDEDYEILELTYNTRSHKFGREAVSRGRPSPGFVFVRLKINKDD